MEQLHPLCDPLPSTVSVGGRSYAIVTSFRDWIAFFEMLENEQYSPKEKIWCAMHWYLARPPCNTAAYDALIQFASCEALPKLGCSGKQTSAASISYRYDAACIIGDFLRYYNIDLLQNDMHWYRFRMLLDALPDSSGIKQRAGYRTVNLADIKDKKMRNQIRKIQDSIRIPQKDLNAAQIGAVFG